MKWLELIKELPKLFMDFFKDLLLVKYALWIIKSKWAYTLLVTILAIGYVQGRDAWIEYKAEYERLNAEANAEDEAGPGMQFTMIQPGLYTMTGAIEEDDCNRIVRDMPTEEHFTVILESPGGNLAEGSCLASHLKIRNVVTVVRDTPVYDENNKIIYQPGLIGAEDRDEKSKDNVICASACGLLFIAGDARYLIGDVWLGIHGPATPPGDGPSSIAAAEQGMLSTASQLLSLLTELGVDDPETRRLFIQIPAYTMYWLKPGEFHLREGLMFLATHYYDFWGFTGVNHMGAMEGE